jgi:L-ascorbate metabolism protein UlaG (beta-lactamase superfamily)
MKIRWLGHASFEITTKGGTVVVTDPYEDSIGISMPQVSADVITVSHGHFDHAAVSEVGGNPRVIDSAAGGQFKDVKVTGISTAHDESGGSKRGKNIVFIIEAKDDADTIRLCHMGDLGHTLDAATAAKLKNVDVLMLPVGGTYTIDSSGATKVVEQVTPGIAIPMHYRIPGLTLDISGVDGFLGNKKNVVRQRELNVARKDIPAPTRIVVLEPQHG